MEVCPYSYFQCCGYFWGPWVSLVTTCILSEGHKIYSMITVSWTHRLPFCFWPIFNSMNYGHVIKKDVNQVTLNYTTLWNLALQISEAFVPILLHHSMQKGMNLPLDNYPLLIRQAPLPRKWKFCDLPLIGPGLGNSCTWRTYVCKCIHGHICTFHFCLDC